MASALGLHREKAVYTGSLLFDDVSFCHHIYRLLRDHCGRPIRHIAGLDLSDTLQFQTDALLNKNSKMNHYR